MTSSRDAFLQRVRQAVQTGNSLHPPAPLEDRGQLGYQGGGTDLVACFCRECTAAGGRVHLVQDIPTASDTVLKLVEGTAARRVLLGQGSVLDRLSLAGALADRGKEVIRVETLTAQTSREPFFAADVGISGVDYLIAETGSLAVTTKTNDPRSVSLLPPVHIAVADRSQILPDLFDLFEPERWQRSGGMPACLSLITGPSKTGDIELRLVTGVHGPGEVHVVLLNPAT